MKLECVPVEKVEPPLPKAAEDTPRVQNNKVDFA